LNAAGTDPMREQVVVSMALVNAIKYSKPKPAKRPGCKAIAAAGGAMSAAELIATKQMVDSLGGIDQAKDVLDLLERLK
jgi:hypothetical protein